MSKPKGLHRTPGPKRSRPAHAIGQRRAHDLETLLEGASAVRAPVPAQNTGTELLDRKVRLRFEQDMEAAIRRRSDGEGRLAGALRALAPLSPSLRAALGEATSVLVERKAFHRKLFACGLRALAEAQDHQLGALLRQALAADEAGGPAALSAACFSRETDLGERLANIASSHRSHVAFGAELARVSRGESNGSLLAELAPKIKESHRIAMCTDLFAPLARAPNVSVGVIPAFALLRSAERHLGRWLLLAEVGARAGDRSALGEARERAQSGAASARAAWTLVAWALEDADAVNHLRSRPTAPSVRLTLELIARLSDRPSAQRDTSFLFRIASVSPRPAEAMLGVYARTLPLGDETAIRAGLFLARDLERSDLRVALATAAETGRREDLRGLAAAACWDTVSGLDAALAGAWRERIREVADHLLISRFVVNRAWGALICAAHAGGIQEAPLVGELSYRWIQSGRLE